MTLLAALAAGCFGKSPHSNSVQPVPHGISAKTGVLITYAVGGPQRLRSKVAACPRHATCSIIRTRRVVPRLWIRSARRHLNCQPDVGTYDDAKAACRALTTLVAFLLKPQQNVCKCPLSPNPPFKLAGFVENKDVRFRFDGCRLCGSPASVLAAWRYLTTQA